MLELADWWCMPYVIASPLHLFIVNGNKVLPSLPALPALQNGERVPLLTHCAANAFFGMTLPQLRKLDKQEVDSLTGEATLPEVLSTMVRKVLGCDDDTLSGILIKRCHVVHSEREHLIQSEEAQVAFDRQDQQECEASAKRMEVALGSSDDLMQCVKGLRSSGDAKKKKAKKASHVWPPDNKVRIQQAEGMVPPKYYLFHDIEDQRMRIFDCNTPARVSISRSLPYHGEGSAVRQCLEWAWRRYLAGSESDCPVDGLFAGPVVELAKTDGGSKGSASSK